MHSFGFPVAGLVAWLTYLTRNTVFFAEQILRLVLASSVRSENVESAMELPLKKRHGMLKLLGCGILILSQKNFAIICTVVDKIYHIMVFKTVFWCHWSLEVRAYDSNDHINGRVISCISTWLPIFCLFPLCTNLTFFTIYGRWSDSRTRFLSHAYDGVVMKVT